MAHLEVQRKKSSNWWLWLLLALIAIALIVYFMWGRNRMTNTAVTTTDTVAVADNSNVSNSAYTNRDEVDFNVPSTRYDEVNDQSITVGSNANYTVYSLGEDVLFAKGKSNLQNDASVKLHQVAASINKRFKNSAIGVYGHTDTSGTASSNKELGEARAKAVKEWLVKNATIDSINIAVHSLGESMNKNTQSTDAANRYVRIVAFNPASRNQQ